MRWRTSRNSSSAASNRSRSPAITLSISSFTIRTRSRMLLSVRMCSRIWSMIRRSNRLARSLGVVHVPFPRFSSEWQT